MKIKIKKRLKSDSSLKYQSFYVSIINMRNTFIGIFLFTCLLSINAQDKITLKNGQELNVTILEKTDTKIKYKSNDSISSNTIFTTKLNKLETIHYGNGIVDLLSSKNPRSKYHWGVMVGTSIPYMGLTLELDYLLTPNFSAEANVLKYIYDKPLCFLGGKYWFANKYSSSGFSPYMGVYFILFHPHFLEIPIGLSYISKSGFQVSAQINQFNYIHPIDFESVTFGELRIGWRFK